MIYNHWRPTPARLQREDDKKRRVQRTPSQAKPSQAKQSRRIKQMRQIDQIKQSVKLLANER
ncbi:hypothetical protein [Polaromonas sp. DSR2-3-2]|uniref:hypothetical protein n=1 Tax=unclassified Polaromonas TaxID=2638319 RepID=UPI003CE6CB85